jgi:hypothetical protein
MKILQFVLIISCAFFCISDFTINSFSSEVKVSFKFTTDGVKIDGLGYTDFIDKNDILRIAIGEKTGNLYIKITKIQKNKDIIADSGDVPASRPVNRHTTDSYDFWYEKVVPVTDTLEPEERRTKSEPITITGSYNPYNPTDNYLNKYINIEAPFRPEDIQAKDVSDMDQFCGDQIVFGIEKGNYLLSRQGLYKEIHHIVKLSPEYLSYSEGSLIIKKPGENFYFVIDGILLAIAKQLFPPPAQKSFSQNARLRSSENRALKQEAQSPSLHNESLESLTIPVSAQKQILINNPIITRNNNSGFVSLIPDNKPKISIKGPFDPFRSSQPIQSIVKRPTHPQNLDPFRSSEIPSINGGNNEEKVKNVEINKNTNNKF